MSRVPGPLVHRGAAGRRCSWPAWPARRRSPSAALVGIDDDAALLLAFVAAAGFSVVVNVQAYLRVLDRPLPFVLLSLGAALGGPALGLALLLGGDGTAAEYLAGLAAGYVLTALAGLALTVRRSRHVRGDTRRALRVGLPTIPHQVALYLAGGALVLVAGHLYGTAEAGRLQLAVLIGSAPGVLTASLNNAWAPDRLPHRPRPPRGGPRAHQPRHRRARRAGGRFRRPHRPDPAAHRGAEHLRPDRAHARRRARRDRHRAVGALPGQRPPRLRVRPQRRPGPGHPDGAARRRRRRLGGREWRISLTAISVRDDGHLRRDGGRASPSSPAGSAPPAGASRGSLAPTAAGTALCVLGAALPAAGPVAGGPLGRGGSARRPLARSCCGRVLTR